MFDESASWDWKNSEEYVSLVDGELTNDGEQTVVESSIETPTSTPPSSTPSTPQSYHSSSSNDETSDKLPSQRFWSMEDIYNSSQFALMVSDPVSYDEAASKEEWQQAMKEEMAAIENNGTWKIVDLPCIGLKWVYKSKFAADGSLKKHKARLVAKEYAQQHAQQQWSVYQFDVKSAFLNGELVYVEQPEDFVKKDTGEKVYKLTKALYGLKQAPRAWYSKIDKYFKQNGFKRSANEPTLYVKKGGKNDFIIVCLYVDDIIYTSSSKSLVAEFKSHRKNKFEMTDLCLLYFFLGLEVCQTDGGIFISQKKYVKDLLKKFSMINCKPATTPMNVNEKLQQNDGAEMANAQRFRSLVGGLIYLTHTRPDISYSIGVISRFMQHPSRDHFGAANRVMRYIAGIIEYGIWYSKVTDYAGSQTVIGRVPWMIGEVFERMFSLQGRELLLGARRNKQLLPYHLQKQNML
ncbi:putative gag-pol polyprotein, identical [Cucumis melo var. makuwa]|uniref:Gag-pol polyprotein, identical n=1 Tax=Cucumis melo var. makuwa TaxID=1194695 RepID=A0A5D3CN49_CUCMM|nr:putative gag-pol polyprotein, identical [Cucumis melo var. makuwa]TYK12578.1 putative gag-pol polyprotein, identical [Cucumis melo var. makuwa]